MLNCDVGSSCVIAESEREAAIWERTRDDVEGVSKLE